MSCLVPSLLCTYGIPNPSPLPKGYLSHHVSDMATKGEHWKVEKQACYLHILPTQKVRPALQLQQLSVIYLDLDIHLSKLLLNFYHL